MILHHKIKKTVLNFSLFLLLISFSNIYSQSGSIKGKVVDSSTKEALFGANVVIKGTSLGSAADIEGNYIIRNVPIGKQTIEISYIGYNLKSTEVNIVENKTLSIDFDLNYKIIEGEVVTVVGQAKGQLQAINQQLTSTGVTSVVSRDRIQEVPDANAAESVGRLPGISIKRSSGEGNEVVVRGIQPRLNLITINNIRMPSTNEYNTAVGLAGISQYLIDGIEVRKSLTASDDADVIGAIVDLKLATAPEDLHGSAIVENMYNGLTKNFGSYRSSIHVSNRFFENKLGVIAQLNLEQADRTNHALSAGYNRDTKTTSNLGVSLVNGNFQKNEITRDRFGATLLLDYKLPNGKIQANSIYSKFNEDRWENEYNFNIASGSVGANKNMRAVDEMNYTLVNGLNLETEVFGSAIFDIGAAITSGNRDGDTKSLSFWYDGAKNAPVEKSFYENPYGKIAYDIIPNMLDTVSNYLLSRMYREDRLFEENEQSYQTNLKIPIDLSSQLSGFVKLGGKIRLKDRNFNYEYDGDTGGIYGGDSDILLEIMRDNPEITWAKWTVTDPKFKAYPMYESGSEKVLEDKVTLTGFTWQKLLEQMVDRAKASNWANLPQWFQKIANDLARDYKGDENLFAGYLMTDFNWWKIISLNMGVRYEKEETNYSGYGVFDVASSVEDLLDTLDVAKRTNEYLLPSATLRYNYSDWGDIRFAYSKSIARPEYYAFVPHYSATIAKSFQEVAGNTHLEPAVSNNFDIIFSFYNNYVGLLTVGGFYKEIDNFFYQANFEVIDETADNHFLKENNYNFSVPKGQYINIWLNLDRTSYLRGLELDWQTNFWYLPSPLNGIVLGVNYTKIGSKAYYYTPKKIKIQDGPRPWEFHEERIDSFQATNLIDQPNDIFNISFGYDFKDFSMRLAYYFQGKTLTWKANYVEQDGYSHNYSRLDFSIRQKLPVQGLSVQFLLSNLTREAEKSYTYIEKYNNNEQYYGMSGSLGLRYEL